MEYKNWHALGSGHRAKTRTIINYSTGAQRAPDQRVNIHFENEDNRHLRIEMSCEEVRDLIHRLQDRLAWIDEKTDD